VQKIKQIDEKVYSKPTKSLKGYNLVKNGCKPTGKSQKQGQNELYSINVHSKFSFNDCKEGDSLRPSLKTLQSYKIFNLSQKSKKETKRVKNPATPKKRPNLPEEILKKYKTIRKMFKGL
jgi:hypothetical protein